MGHLPLLFAVFISGGPKLPYFETIRSPIVAGRGILPTDIADGPRVLLINETMARMPSCAPTVTHWC